MSDFSAAYPAPAKLNLMLRVLGQRTDGYHLLQTVFRFIEYGDTLRFRVRSDGQITRVNPLQGIAAEDDLCVRAARALQAAAGVRLGADIELEKRLPMGGGLGGGSSDAATTLLVLNNLWQTGLNRAQLQGLAGKLGADVPVFVFGKNAVAGGIGDELAAINLPSAWYVVLIPPVAVSTASVFAHPNLKRDSKKVTLQSFADVIPANDLEPLVCLEYPVVERHLVWLRQQGARSVMMSGSGACVFAAFETQAAACGVLAKLPADMRGFVAHGLERHPLHGLAS
jgi:4-diphosphocytidyl-2-C-methyl-D-erythritol kinase